MQKKPLSYERTGILAIAVLMLAMCAWANQAQSSSPTPAAGAATEVKIDNFTYGPAELTVPVGTTVKWTNHDDMPHTVTSEDKSFASKALDTDDTFIFTFTKPGTYIYFCTIHPKMTAKIVVR
jgi:plastocyanin